ncbi:hypothetical protein Ccrd_005423, partial [Cynara cardunculus var. scolymus]
NTWKPVVLGPTATLISSSSLETPFPYFSVFTFSLRSKPQKSLIMAAPVTGEASLDEERSGSQIVINKLKTPNSAEDNLIIAQLSKTALTQLHVPCASSLSKRRKSKPMRFDVSRTDVRKEHSSPKIK